MFLSLNKIDKNKIAAIDDKSGAITYGNIVSVYRDIEFLNLPRSIVFCICDNSVGALIGYAAFMSCNIVPVMLGYDIDDKLLSNLIDVYSPSYIWQNKTNISDEKILYENYNFKLIETKSPPYQISDKLSILLTTSGSTGSPKLVRHKYGNLEANAKNVSEVFGWSKNERGIIALPMEYTMGLNVINTHLYAGATVLLTSHNIMSSDFWSFIKEHKGTNFTGVPFSYEIMFKLRFDKMDLPYLTTFAEGGGKLTDEMFMKLAKYSSENNKRFFATFGATETSARIAYLEPEIASKKCGSIGKAIPEGTLFLIDENGDVIDKENTEGELCYCGPNVAMGYAQCREDLLLDDEWNGCYHTGDIARRDSDGCYYIVGRKSRFLKLLGYRVSMDQCERLINSEFNIECACIGTDKGMVIYLTEDNLAEQVKDFISKKTRIYKALFSIRHVDEIPKNEFGKILYRILPL